jgi:hopanoid biosynthesis associated protein HpnK
VATQLILNADDFGLTRGVNEGIVRAHRDGILTSATLMANGDAFDHAVQLARATPSLGVGCHLVLIGGKPVADPHRVPSLVDSEGKLPASLPALVARVTSGKIRIAHMEIELLAQVEKIRAAGITPTHFDTHKHTHAHPRVLQALGRMAQSVGILRVRRPIEKLSRSLAAGGKGRAKQFIATSAVRAVSSRFDALARKYGLRSPGHFLGLASTGLIGPEVLRHLVKTLPTGQTEIMLHPGICDIDLERTGTRLLHERERELQALLDPEVKRAVSARNVQLISYRELV